MRGNIYFYWILIVVTLRILSYAEYFFYGEHYNKEYFYKEVSFCRGFSNLFFIIGLVAILVFYFVEFTKWFFIL